jgi:phosphoribosylanthranilate isomerase
MFLKICGITRLEDARRALDEGATALGFVFWTRSPRAVTPERAADIVAALPATVTTVGVFVNDSIDSVREIVTATGIAAVQLHGDEPANYADAIGRPILRSVTLDDASETYGAWPKDTTWLLDAADRVRRGGTGMQVDWRRASVIARDRRVVLAGGLTPDNVADAIAAVQPYGVDVSSGVEATPGVKDGDKVARFLANARRAFSQAADGVRPGQR